MTGEQVLEVLRAAVVRVLEVPADQVTRQARLVEDLHADSLAIVEIVEIVEEDLTALTSRPLRLEDEKLDGLQTIGDVVDLVVEGL